MGFGAGGAAVAVDDHDGVHAARLAVPERGVDERASRARRTVLAGRTAEVAGGKEVHDAASCFGST
jgi:hypothetical protein